MVRRGLAILALSLIPLAISGLFWRSELKLNAGPRAAVYVVEVPQASHYRVEFSTDEGRRVVATLRTTRSYQVGDRLHVTYDRANPERVRWSREDTNAWRTPLLVAITLWLLAGGFFAAAIGRSPTARRLAARTLTVTGFAAAAAGLSLLVWAMNRDYADNQRNWGFMLGFVGLLAGVVMCGVGLAARRPARSR